MHEQSATAGPFPSCFFSFNTDEPPAPAAPPRPGQSLVTAVYSALVAGRRRHVTVTWCRDLLVNGLSVSVEGSEGDAEEEDRGGAGRCKVELRPWQFWRRQGAKRFDVNGIAVEVLWDLRAAKFSAVSGGDPEPQSGYYVAVVSNGELVLLLGDLKKEAFRKSGCHPSIVTDGSALVSRTEHLFGKRRFATRVGFCERDRQLHDVSIELSTAAEAEMVVRVDGKAAIRVKHLQWKFRGNHSISMDKGKMDVYWDVHDWLFGKAGPTHALFIFKPVPPPPLAEEVGTGGGSPEFCLLLYAWKVE